MNELVLVLEQFGGGQGGLAGAHTVRFLLAAFFWGVLALVSTREWCRSDNRRDLFVLLAALVGLTRELLMFIAEYGSYRGLVHFPDMFLFYPPLEHVLTMLSSIGIAFAFMWNSLVNTRFAKFFLLVSTIISIALYLIIAPNWIQFLEQYPGSPFGSYAGDMVFRVTASLILAVALMALYHARQRGKQVSLLLLAGIGCFFLDEFLMIFNLASDEQYVAIFAPVRHNLHIWAIPILISSYWIELGDQLRAAARKSQEDLDARLEAQATLQLNEARYRTLVENLPVGISLVDNEFRITMVNRKMGELFRRSAESFVGQFCYDQFDKGKEIYLCYSDTKNMSSLQVNQIEAEGIRGDDSHFAAHLTTVPLQDQGGRSTGFIVLVEDVTAKIQAAAEKRQLQEHLRHAEKMEAIGHLAGGVAHDFNNQLTGVLGYADILLLRLKDEKFKEYVRNIKNSAERSASLIQQLLAFGRKGKYLSVPVAIDQIVEEVVSILERSIDKRIQISNICQDGPLMVLGDPAQLQNAILNIALNARDAMPGGGKMIFETKPFNPPADWKFSKVYSEEQSDTNYLQVSVGDTGDGMDADTMKHIFEPFFTTKEMGKGTGMGLASAYGTLSGHKGHIDVESGVGKGTTFHLYLPLCVTDLPAVQLKSRRFIKGKARILLVDDEPAVRETAAEMLQTLGYQVSECKNGQEAVDQYRQAWREIDMVIMDMIMPVMDGRDAVIAMQMINPDVRVLLCSGYSLDGRAQSILKEGKVGFIGKPFTVIALSERVAEALNWKS